MSYLLCDILVISSKLLEDLITMFNATYCLVLEHAYFRSIFIYMCDASISSGRTMILIREIDGISTGTNDDTYR